MSVSNTLEANGIKLTIKLDCNYNLLKLLICAFIRAKFHHL